MNCKAADNNLADGQFLDYQLIKRLVSALLNRSSSQVEDYKKTCGFDRHAARKTAK